MTFRQSEVVHIRVEIGVAFGATMLRVVDEDIAGSSCERVAEVVEDSGNRSESVSVFSALGARPAPVVSAPSDDLRLGKILNTSDSLGFIGYVFSGFRHVDVLRQRVLPDTSAYSVRFFQKNSVMMLQSQHFSFIVK